MVDKENLKICQLFYRNRLIVLFPDISGVQKSPSNGTKSNFYRLFAAVDTTVPGLDPREARIRGRG